MSELLISKNVDMLKDLRQGLLSEACTKKVFTMWGWWTGDTQNKEWENHKRKTCCRHMHHQPGIIYSYFTLVLLINLKQCWGNSWASHCPHWQSSGSVRKHGVYHSAVHDVFIYTSMQPALQNDIVKYWYSHPTPINASRLHIWPISVWLYNSSTLRPRELRNLETRGPAAVASRVEWGRYIGSVFFINRVVPIGRGV